MPATSLRAAATPRRKANTLLLFAIVLAAAAGCVQSISDAGAPDVFGTYSLATVNGSALPATVSVGSTNDTFTSGALALTDSSYDITLCVRATGTDSACGTGSDELRESGHWYATGHSLVMQHSSDGGRETATFSPGQVTVPFGTDGVLLTFLKQ